MRNVWARWCWCLVVIGAVACGKVTGEAPDAGPGTPPPDAAPPPLPTVFQLELVAGDIGGAGNVDGTGASARFNTPTSVAVDSSGNVFVADENNSLLRKVSRTGEVTTVAGAAGVFGTADGSGAVARFDFPTGVAVDGAGSVYVIDTNNSTVRKVTSDGTVSTLAGDPLLSGGGDGTGIGAQFRFPTGGAVDLNGNVFVADRGNDTVRKITAAGVVTTIAGSPQVTGTTDATGAAARFNGPTGVAVDATGNVFVADQNNHTIRKIAPGGAVITLAGGAGLSGTTDATGTAARFNGPASVAVDVNVFVADQNNHTIRKIAPGGAVTTIAGAAGKPGTDDGIGTAARFTNPSGVAVAASGTLFIADQRNAVIRKMTPDGAVTTVAGAPILAGSVDGTGAAARFNRPIGVATDAAGNTYVADSANAVIRKITSTGVTTTIAGTVGVEGGADGVGAAAQFTGPSGIAVDSTGNLYVAEIENNTIRKITSTGTVTTLAGVAGKTGATDGAGNTARFCSPSAVVVDSTGNLFVTDQANHTIRKITSEGVVSTVAGTAGQRGTTDGNGAAARFDSPSALTVDGAGNLYVTDANNYTIRKITPTGDVTTLAGTAGVLGNADGTGAAARFSSLSAIAIDATGNLYAADIAASTVRKITPTGEVTTVVGVANATGILLGPTPRLAHPSGIAAFGGDLMISDTNAILVLHRAPIGD
jgi:hypothetical protein